jgi:hypothetical protein
MTKTQTPQNAGILEAVADPRVLDPLSEVTRRERKALLLASLMAFAISVGGLVPNEIKALGITLSQTEREAMLVLVSLLILYLLAGFWVYSLADLRSRNLAIALGRQKISPDLAAEMSTAQERVRTIIGSKDFQHLTADPEIKRFFSISEELKLASRVRTVGTLRVAFDLYLPVLVGLAAVAVSLSEARGLMAACLIAFVTTFVVAGIAVVQGIRGRKRIISFIRNRRSRWYQWRLNRGMKRLKELDPQSAENAELRDKLKRLLEKSISNPPV